MYPETIMAEDNTEAGSIPKITRRHFLGAAAAAIGGIFLGHELTKPNLFEEQARKLWEEYETNPQEFLNRNPNGVMQNLVAGESGVNLRNIPSAEGGREGIVGYLKPNEPVGTALIFPNQRHTPDGPFLTVKQDSRVVFVAENQLKQPK